MNHHKTEMDGLQEATVLPKQNLSPLLRPGIDTTELVGMINQFCKLVQILWLFGCTLWPVFHFSLAHGYGVVIVYCFPNHHPSSVL